MTDSPATPAPVDPLAIVRAGARAEPPRRFYAAATSAPRDGGHALLLDGRPARTPRRRPLVLPTAAAATVVAAEWAAQGERIDPATMPATRVANSAIDGVADDPAAARDAVAAYAGSDLVCYRAASPAGLVVLQTQHWDPVIAFAREALGARFALAEGVMPVAQPDPALAAVARALAPEADPLRLAALATLTTLAGSALIALALARGALDPDAAWAAAHVDEDWEIAGWGEDEEAAARRAARRREFDAAAALLVAVPAARAPAPHDDAPLVRAAPGDAAAVRALVRAAYARWVPVLGREPVPMGADYERAVREHEIDLLRVDGALVALVEMYPAADHLFIENVAVAPAHQGRGLGRRLLAHAERRALALGLGRVRLLTSEAFAANVRLYESAGYRVDRVEPFMDGATVHMSKPLTGRPPTA